MPREIPKAYEPQEIEKRWAKVWVEQKLFRGDADAPGPVFSIVIPPPNVTGSLHIGHMLNHTEIDILTRWRRMLGYNTLYLPGTDHAGIATQRVVERMLEEQGLSRKQLGREAFVQKAWEWKEHYGNRITEQMVHLGESCDWTRERFTLDPGLSRAVREVFVRLYEEGLIYRGRYIVNWCPRCITAISDLETIYEERQGHLWHIRYPVAGSDEYIVVATTRPETMLGDTAVAVHPDDARYRHLVGRKVRLPLMEREIPVIADAYVDREFATGVVKVTPAHDPNDFEAGKRHNLPEVDVMTDDGHMSAAAGAFAGMERMVARKEVVEALKAQGLLEKITDHIHALGTCQRCKTAIEPRLSTQWFVRMKPLAEPAIAVVERNEIEIVPENWRAVYFEWMRNIRDWCISRQLWWGHRIPAWHCAACGEVSVSRQDATQCAKCGSAKIEQDPDVLDTWFSSALWPFSTLGWPEDTQDMRVYYPTTLMITGYDILFFWVARMIMMGLKFAGQIPFRRVYLHSLVRDAERQKMSKSKGNVIDPIEVNRKYGTDAVRFTLAIMAAPGTDIALSEERMLSYRAFANKVWNAARFLFVNLDKIEAAGVTLEELAAPAVRAGAPYRVSGALALVDRWMFSRLSAVAAQVSDALEGYRFHEAAHVVYHFFWGEFCDWYIEWVKPQLAADNREAAIATWRNLFAVFEAALRLLHPFMPFLTEELWHKLPQRSGAKSIALETYPVSRHEWSDAESEIQMNFLQDGIRNARNQRAVRKLDRKKKVPGIARIWDEDDRGLIQENLEPLMRLASLSELQFSFDPLEQGRVVAGLDLRILEALPADLGAEVARLRKEKERLEKDIETKQKRLADESFRTHAPEQVVRALEATLKQRRVEYRKLVERLARMEKSLRGEAGAGS
jgi:valyl-tRNA synthetase